jgi:hypothetical protein
MVSDLNRRRFFGTLSAAVLAGVGVAHSALGAPVRALTAVAAASAPQKGGGDFVAGAPAPPQRIARVALPGGGVLS